MGLPHLPNQDAIRVQVEHAWHDALWREVPEPTHPGVPAPRRPHDDAPEPGP